MGALSNSCRPRGPGRLNRLHGVVACDAALVWSIAGSAAGSTKRARRGAANKGLGLKLWRDEVHNLQEASDVVLRRGRCVRALRAFRSVWWLMRPEGNVPERFLKDVCPLLHHLRFCFTIFFCFLGRMRLNPSRVGYVLAILLITSHR